MKSSPTFGSPFFERFDHIDLFKFTLSKLLQSPQLLTSILKTVNAEMLESISCSEDDTIELPIAVTTDENIYAISVTKEVHQRNLCQSPYLFRKICSFIITHRRKVTFINNLLYVTRFRNAVFDLAAPKPYTRLFLPHSPSFRALRNLWQCLESSKIKGVANEQSAPPQ